MKFSIAIREGARLAEPNCEFTKRTPLQMDVDWLEAENVIDGHHSCQDR